MNTILLYFNVHIQALNIHPLASLAPLLEFFLADIFCVIYISRQAAKFARGYSEFILASFAPLRDFFLADIFCVIYISRQAANLSRIYSEFILAPLTPLRDFFLADIFSWYISRQAAKNAKGIFWKFLASFAPLRDHNISCARTITSCEIYFPPSRQGCKDYAIGKFRSLQIINDSTYVAIL